MYCKRALRLPARSIRQVLLLLAIPGIVEKRHPALRRERR